MAFSYGVADLKIEFDSLTLPIMKNLVLIFIFSLLFTSCTELYWTADPPVPVHYDYRPPRMDRPHRMPPPPYGHFRR